MAKNAKQVDVAITARFANKLIGDILEKYADLETARGRFMNNARRIREGIQGVIDAAAAKGIPAKITKLTIKIEQTETKLKALLAELDSEERKLLKNLISAHGSKSQLQLFADLPPAPKPPPVIITAATTNDNKKPAKQRRGASGEDIELAERAAAKAPEAEPPEASIN